MAKDKYTPEEGEAAIRKEIEDKRRRAEERQRARDRGEINQTHDKRLYPKGQWPWQKGS